jgi:hypothetical protein
MVFRLIFAVMALTAIGAAALAIRQQRLVTAHDISACHNAIYRNRLATRTLQTQISGKTSPDDIASACKRARLQLEPVKPTGQVLPDPANPAPSKPTVAGGVR